MKGLKSDNRMAFSRWAGQATTEYILLLVIVFLLFKTVQTVLGPVFVKYAQRWTATMEQRFSKGLHQYRF